MSTRQHDNEMLGAYVLGALDEREAQAVEEHVKSCETCREEVSVLREWETALGEVPPEAFLDGPPEDGEPLLRRTLRQAREERGTAERLRRSLLAAAAVVAAAAVLGGGFAIGRSTGEDRTRPAARPSAVSSPPVAPAPTGVVVASARDRGTGARMAVRMTPSAEWVRLNVSVSGIPAGERCRIVVVSRDGTREVAGSWLVGSAEKGANLDGSAAVAREDVASIAVENEAGKTYVATPLRT
ncbi:hypothetical protein GCM10010387_26710 [Streptomyces inusitatus]|uniref:Putative zinc-finger domain-containing protein n=1 Tax=Streptomyces inusitatus TaxID=68221 RepID=A0A918UST3_9ACTN|nr:zf-HC2 domain-containing protein [Streptomyces inusitatus]GGZ31424.1 hypothetical protein GCM10010387_26710 [Streptomyces inusitatus]